MDSATLLGIAGIGGTVVGAIVGAGGALGSAYIASRSQSRAEDQRSRRQAYSNCSTALITRRDAAKVLMEQLREDRYDPEAAQVQMRDLLDQRQAVMGAVGVVAVEGPPEVAHLAESAAETLQGWADRLRDWIVNYDRDMISDQFQFGREDQRDVSSQIEDYLGECRKILHPEDRHEHRSSIR